MAVLARLPRRPRRARLRLRGDARALRRRRSHGLLQRPAAVRGRARTGRADGAPDAGPRRRARDALAPAGPRPRLRRRHRAGLRDARPGRLRGAVGLRRHRDRHQRGRAAVRGRCRPPGPHQPARACRPRRALRDALARPDGAARHLTAPRGPRGHRHRRRRRTTHERDHPSTSPTAPPAPTRWRSTTSTRTARGELFDVLQGRLPEVWRLMRQGDPHESVVVVPSMSVDRLGALGGRDEPGAWRSASSSCCCSCASRGCGWST